MSKRPNYDLAIVLVILGGLLALALLLGDSLVQDGKLRDLQRRVGRLEQRQ